MDIYGDPWPPSENLQKRRISTSIYTKHNMILCGRVKNGHLEIANFLQMAKIQTESSVRLPSYLPFLLVSMLFKCVVLIIMGCRES